jgi:APA family basic amino acid/polyamine antiporter
MNHNGTDVSSESTSQLRRVLTLREAVALGIGGTIDGGIFVLVGTAAERAGPGAALAFVCAFCLSLFIALPYAELACRYPLAGGGYAFARTLLGRHWGFFMGWDYWGAYIFISGYVTLGFGGYLHALTDLPPVDGALILIGICTGINLIGVRLSGLAQSIVIGTAIAALLVFCILGLPHVHLEQFTAFMPFGFGGLAAASLLAFLAFGGFDMVAAAGEEIAAPERNLPKAILLTLLGVLGLYLLVTFVAIGVTSAYDLGKSPAPLAAAATIFLGTAGQKFMAIVAIMTTAATGNAVLVVTSRVSFAMARDGLLPKCSPAYTPRQAFHGDQFSSMARCWRWSHLSDQCKSRLSWADFCTCCTSCSRWQHLSSCGVKAVMLRHFVCQFPG